MAKDWLRNARSQFLLLNLGVFFRRVSEVERLELEEIGEKVVHELGGC